MLLSRNTICEGLASMPRRHSPLAGHVASAVLMLFFDKDDQTHLVFIRKTRGPVLHSGQMAFPGGRIESSDRDGKATAMRETFEEIGVARDTYEIIAEMGFFETITTRYDASVYVAWAEHPPKYHREAFEVDAIIEIPVEALFQQFNPALDLGDESTFMTLAFTYYQEGESAKCNIWGLTARIVHQFLMALSE